MNRTKEISIESIINEFNHYNYSITQMILANNVILTIEERIGKLNQKTKQTLKKKSFENLLRLMDEIKTIHTEHDLQRYLIQ